MNRPVPPLWRQLHQVSRRLWLQALIERLAWCCTCALAVTAVWLLVHPFLAGQPETWLRWSVLGGTLGVATALAAFLTWRQAPSALAAALALDEKFNLQQRVATSVQLTPLQTASPAGEALLADVNQRLEPLQIKERFPLRLSWSAALVPVTGLVVALLTFFYAPSLGTATAQADAGRKDALAAAPEVQKQIDALKKKPRPWTKEQLDKEKMKEIDAAWEKLVNQPLDPKNQEQVRERVQAMRDLEEKMKERLDALKAQADKSQAVKQQLGKLAKQDPAGKNLKEGPAKDLQDALAKGNMAKAREEVERLMKKIQQDKLTPEEQKKLADDLEKLEKQLERLADQQQQKEQLARDRQDGKIDDDKLERENQRLQEEAADLDQLDDLARGLKECQACLRAGNRKLALAKLGRLLEELEQLDLDERQLQELRDAAADLEEAREGLCECLGEQEGRINALGKGKRPGTLRPVAPDSPTKSKDSRQRADVDPRGQQRVTGFTRGGSFRKVPAREVGGAFRQAVQDAPEAIERQRVPQDAAEMLKGYYENLGGQKKN
jgi:hypothetical protein